jgi:hypothetical protein
VKLVPLRIASLRGKRIARIGSNLNCLALGGLKGHLVRRENDPLAEINQTCDDTLTLQIQFELGVVKKTGQPLHIPKRTAN